MCKNIIFAFVLSLISISVHADEYDEHRVMCSSNQNQFVTAARTKAIRATNKVIDLRNTDSRKLSQGMIKWFGAKSSTEEKALLSKLKKLTIIDTISHHWCLNKSFHDTGPNDKAFIFPNNSKLEIFIEKPFFTMPTSGLISAYGTILHETLHVSDSSIDDHTYKYSDCLQLAKNNPSLAQTNANNFRFFIEEMSGL